MTDIKKIVIEFIPHDQQRYETVGDYWLEGDTLQIRVSDMQFTQYNCMVALHEFVEWMTTDFAGITEESIMEFDKQYEEERKLNIHTQQEEPGFDFKAPYKDQHTLATSIEMMLCAFLGIDWKMYDDVVLGL